MNFRSASGPIRRWARNIDGHRLRRRLLQSFLVGLFRRAEARLSGAGQLVAGEIHRILILRPNHRLGNLLLLTPLIAELERRFPGAEVDLLTSGDQAHEVFANFFSVRHVYALPRHLPRHPVGVAKVMASLRRTVYDLIIDPCADSNSNRVILSWLRMRHAIGMPSPTSALDASWARILFSAPQHLATLPVFLLRHALSGNGAVDDVHYPPLDLRLSKAERMAGRRVLRSILPGCGPTVIGIFANATGNKRFEQAFWMHLLTPLMHRHPEYRFVELVPAEGCSLLGGRFPTFYSSHSRKLAAVIANLSCFISGDCGVMHLASASGTPVVGLFSVTDAGKYEPYGAHNRSLITSGKSPEQVGCALLRLVEAIAADAADLRTLNKARRNPALAPLARDAALDGAARPAAGDAYASRTASA